MMVTYLSKQMKVSLINKSRINPKGLHRIWGKLKEVRKTHKHIIYLYVYLYIQFYTHMYMLHYKYRLGIHTHKYSIIRKNKISYFSMFNP